MASAYRDGGASAYARLLEGAVSPQSFCTRALGLLEADFRVLALLALADWEALGLVDPELFAAVGALQRPSWGSWNFLLQSLRNARKSQLRSGRAGVRDAIEAARTLQAALGLLDASLAAEGIEAAAPLVDYLGGKARLKRASDVLTLPIALRNQIAHFPPADDAGWVAIRDALVPLVSWHAAHPLPLLSENRAWPEPWFVEHAGEVWAFNGAEKDFAVSYASVTVSKPHAAPERAGMFVKSLQRLLGRTDLQEQSFHRLLAKLAPEDIRGVVLGDFLVGPAVARGGFATVHLGRQLSTGRKVALKLLHDGLTEDARLRFQQEAAFLSRISNPSIVGVISYGEDAWTVPRFVDLQDEPWFQEFSRGSAIKTFIALEWIDGETLEDRFQKVHVAKTAVAPSLVVLRGWFRDAATALAAVHAAGLIHRDIKPANFMISSDGDLRLMDFGIARSDDESRTLMTSTGFALGTPPYMSPEQIRAHDADAEVGPTTDVYSLCATFYELVTGTRLFAHDRESLETVKTQKLRGELPARPTGLVRGLPWELETILMGGLQAEVANRYQSAESLARDLAHWERNEPIEYQRPSLVRRASLAYRRHRGISNLVAGFLVVLAVGATFYVRNIKAEQARADRERAIAEDRRVAAERALAWNLVEQGRMELLARHPARAAAFLAAAYPTLPDEPMVRFLVADATRDVARQAATLEGHAEVVNSAAFSPDGLRVVTASLDHTARLWDARTGTLVATLAGHTESVESAAFSPDGQRVVTASRDNSSRLWDARTGEPIATFEGHTGTVNSAVFSPDGQRVVTASDDLTARVWDARTGKLLATLEGNNGSVRSAAFSPDGQRVVTASSDNTSRLWDARTGTLVATLEDQTVDVISAAFSPDGQRVVTASDDLTARVWDARTGKLLAALKHTSPINSAAFSPDGLRVVTASDDRTARLWEVRTGTLVATLEGHTDRVTSAAFSPDGLRVVTASDDRTARLWEVRTGTLLATLEGHTDRVTSAAVSPDGQRVVTASFDHTARLWDVPPGTLLSTLEGHTGTIKSAAFSPDGLRVVTASFDHTARVWDARTGTLVATLEDQTVDVISAAFSPDGLRVVTASLDGTARVWDARTVKLLAALEGHTRFVNSAAFSPDGLRVVTASDDHTARLWDAGTGKLLVALEGHTPLCQRS